MRKLINITKMKKFSLFATLFVICLFLIGCEIPFISKTTPGTTPPKGTSPGVTTTPKPTETIVATAEEKMVFANKDPFQPLVTPYTATTTTTSGPTVTPPTTEQPTPPTTPTAVQAIGLKAIFTSKGVEYATFLVGPATTAEGKIIISNPTEYTVKEGETFGTVFKCLTINTESVTILIGDEKWTLHVGQSVLIPAT